MIWHEVTAPLDGVTCTVIFDIKEQPFVFKKYTGKISVGTHYEAMPILKSMDGARVMNPPRWATIILHPPEDGAW